MKLTKAVKEVEKWNRAFQHIRDNDNDREMDWRYDRDYRELAIALVEEEVRELADSAFSDGYLPKAWDVDVLDAICDILVTTFGVAAKAGLTELVEPAFKEVMRANWSKADEQGKPIFNVNGKIAKSSLYKAPDLKQFFDEEDLVE